MSATNKVKGKKLADFGSWPSPISAELLTSKAVGLSEPKITDDEIYWLEYRPEENGRCTVVSYNHGNPMILIPVEFSVRSTAHEYGGGAWTIGDGVIYFVNQGDQRIYSVKLGEHSSAKPLIKKSLRRYADLQFNKSTNCLIAVVEDHSHCVGNKGRDSTSHSEPIASIIEIEAKHNGAERTLAIGADFYSNPRLSPDDSKLLWLQWSHPNMPWTENELWCADLNECLEVAKTEGQKRLKANKLLGDNESIFQPQWSPSDDIYYVSDRSNWWNLYKYNEGAEDTCISKTEQECGLPLWQFGMSTWGFLNKSEAVVAYVQRGIWSLYKLNLITGSKSAFPSSYNSFSHLATNAKKGRAVVIAADGSNFDQLCEIEKNSIEPLYSDGQFQLPVGSISSALPITFETTHFEHAYGFFYPPLNANYTGPAAEKPPLIVICHGGPTGSTSAALNIKIQFWTSRGFAVADINYRGSTGFGRKYRLSLDSNWGVYDVDDACAAAEYCVDQGWVDRDKLIIRGSSAGGYTVLSALCFRETFSAGCSLYGIGDLHTLVTDTHKFESRYIDTLIAPVSETKIYNERSPIKHIDQFNCPIIFFQGLQDKVVPPEQAERMTEALDKAGFPVSLITYKDEAHGFRKANNVIHSLNAELAFYGSVFKIKTDSRVKNLKIANINSTRNRLR